MTDLSTTIFARLERRDRLVHIIGLLFLLKELEAREEQEGQEDGTKSCRNELKWVEPYRAFSLGLLFNLIRLGLVLLTDGLWLLRGLRLFWRAAFAPLLKE